MIPSICFSITFNFPEHLVLSCISIYDYYIYICMTIVCIYIYIYSVHSFHLLFFTTSISLLHFMMAALKSSNNSNISVISMLVSIDYPQGLPYSWFDDWFSTETWTFWGMTLGDSGPYFNVWLDLVSSDRGLAVSGSKRSLSFRMLSNSSSKTHSWVSNKTSGHRSAELLSAGDTALFRLLLSLSRPSDGGVTAHCAWRPRLIWATWKDAATARGFHPSPSDCPSPRWSWPQGKDNLLYRRIANPLETYWSYF